ncbi:PH domain containing protein [Trichomonas vaginalis G3]|uniref:PH domain containing protein n=1 Tax=Trichomonas vaginalis (strain ATCC PRA-98 / G3) TaxID=412133 RepID=A2EM43_TRIV3|nr:nerve growth factor signaling pathway [Trichomonas vaginalis G3]EAY06302.1 PH domain containing protein [Trichomonas vaginalis G3]KAI5503380.1 nerve growth factor signaling pathway [Trichomonas vaginalis G3]|eukprot:XP_001318525.1 PH domain containing protein [Trichomonas vaginalis G3]
MKKTCEIKASYCNKEGVIIHSIKKRYFVLYPDALKYYTTYQGEEKGSIPITGDLIVDNDPKYKIQPCFTIYNPSKKRTYYILPETEIDRDEWIYILNNVINNKKVNGPQVFLSQRPSIYENYVTLSEVIWNAKKEDIPTIIKLIKNATTKNVLSMKQILGMLDYISQRRLKNLEVMAELAHEYIHSQRVPDILSYFKECEHLVAILIKRCALTGKMPEKFVGKSEKDILDIYQPGSLFHCLLHDNVDNLKKIINDSAFNIEKLYDGKSILALAARFGSENCFRYILSKNIPINVEVFEDAYFGGNIQIVEMLKSANFVPLRCIDLAVQNHQSELVTYLMRGKDQEYTWEAALSSYNFKAFFDKLFTKSDVDSTDSKGMIPLMAAASTGFYSIARLLNDLGTYIEIPGPKQYTALHYAVVNDNIEATSFLISVNANLNAITEDNETPLILAAKKDLQNIGFQLCDHKANVDLQDKQGNTALIYAAKNGSQSFISTLVDKNCNVNLANSEGNTAIFYAVLSGKSEIVSQLVDKNALVNIKNGKGETPLIWAARAGNIDVVNTLLDYKASIEEKD